MSFVGFLFVLNWGNAVRENPGILWCTVFIYKKRMQSLCCSEKGKNQATRGRLLRVCSFDFLLVTYNCCFSCCLAFFLFAWWVHHTDTHCPSKLHSTFASAFKPQCYPLYNIILVLTPALSCLSGFQSVFFTVMVTDKGEFSMIR